MNHYVCQSMLSTEFQQQNTTWVHIRQVFLPITPFQVSLLSSTWALKSPRRIPRWFLFQSHSVSKKAGYSELRFGAWVHNTVRIFHSAIWSHIEVNFVHRVKLQNRGDESGACECSETCWAPLTLSNCSEGESPTPIQGFGSRAQSVCGGEANSI